MIDILISVILIIGLSPFLMITAILVRLTSDGPVLFWYPVIGMRGEVKQSCKFRSMFKDAEGRKNELLDRNEMSGPVFKMKGDPRVTPLGRFIRKFSIDELPQLWLVIKGDLSLVGPRAPGPHEFAGFEPWQRRKLSVKPGITCLWQVYGRNQVSDFESWVRMDLEYIDNWSLWRDMAIMLRTGWVVLRGTGY